MKGNDLLTLLGALSAAVTAGFNWCGLLLSLAEMFGRKPPKLVRAVFHEVRPFFLPAVVVSFTIDTVTNDSALWLRGLTLGLNIFNWFMFKDQGGDDDRWKRRKAKLVEKVTAVDGRVVVAPAGDS